MQEALILSNILGVGGGSVTLHQWNISESKFKMMTNTKKASKMLKSHSTQLTKVGNHAMWM